PRLQCRRNTSHHAPRECPGVPVLPRESVRLGLGWLVGWNPYPPTRKYSDCARCTPHVGIYASLARLAARWQALRPHVHTHRMLCATRTYPPRWNFCSVLAHRCYAQLLPGLRPESVLLLSRTP